MSKLLLKPRFADKNSVRRLDEPRKVVAVLFTGKEPFVSLLLVLGRSGLWSLPKGTIETGEDPNTALKREVFEETGINLPLLHHSTEETKAVKIGITRFSIFFISLHRDRSKFEEVPNDEEEILEVKWVPFSKLKEICESWAINSITRIIISRFVWAGMLKILRRTLPSRACEVLRDFCF